MKISVGTEGIMRNVFDNQIKQQISENKEICKHKSDGILLMSNPPKYRCEKCGLSYPISDAANDSKYDQETKTKPINENIMLQALVDSLGFAVSDYTYYMYCQRYSSADYRTEILEASNKIKTLVEYANLSNAFLTIDSNINGYLNINVDLRKDFGLKSIE